MSKPPKKPNPKDIETVPDAWERFEKTIDVVTRKPSKSPAERSGKKKQDDANSQ